LHGVFREGEHQMIRVYKPNFVPGKSRAAVIYLVPKLLSGSSGLPEGFQGEQPCPEKTSGNLLLDLAPSGVCPAFNITIEAVGSYPAFSPLSRFTSERYFFCGTFRVPKKSVPRELPGTSFCGVRTFLPRLSPEATAQHESLTVLLLLLFINNLFFHL